MLSDTLINQLHQLNKTEKLRAVQLLVDDLALEEAFHFTPGATYEVWSPYDSAEAAAILTRLLEEDDENAEISTNA